MVNYLFARIQSGWVRWAPPHRLCHTQNFNHVCKLQWKRLVTSIQMTVSFFASMMNGQWATTRTSSVDPEVTANPRISMYGFSYRSDPIAPIWSPRGYGGARGRESSSNCHNGRGLLNVLFLLWVLYKGIRGLKFFFQKYCGRSWANGDL